LRHTGIYGLSKDENARAQHWGKIFNYLMIAISICLLFEWQHGKIHQYQSIFFPIINWSIWCFFVVEFLVLLNLVDNKRQLILQQWIILLIIILGIPILLEAGPYMEVLRNLRPLLALFILILTGRIIIRFFVDGRLHTTILAAAIIVLIFGIFVAGIDPNINTAWDGIWWAVATVSTVGYGDIVPASLLGRLLGCILVVVGIGVFVVLTANFLKLLLTKESELIEREEQDIEEVRQTLKSIKQEQSKILEALNKLQNQPRD